MATSYLRRMSAGIGSSCNYGGVCRGRSPYCRLSSCGCPQTLRRSAAA
ncbi:hypothetical protein EON64_13410 [archaeon]|nr:MAG: hypothetical protein EON64_13410 [archaeon]